MSPLSFKTGKVPSDVLRRIVFNRLGVPTDRVLSGPGVGEDAAVIDMGDRVLVAKGDPITGAEGNIGWLSVHINANDIASTGARPLWFVCIALLPEGADESLLEGIMDDIHAACTEVGASLVGGHTETTPGLDRPILAGFMMGEAEKDGYVTTGGAKPGDLIILTKGAGIEGTAVIANDLRDRLRGKVDDGVIERGAAMIKWISVVPEAMKAVEAGSPSSLHDPTEGGLINGLWEMAEAAGVGLRVDIASIPVLDETKTICGALGVDPLRLLGSGALLITAHPGEAEKIMEALKEEGIMASVIGEVKPLPEGRNLVDEAGNHVSIEAVEQDEIYRILDELG
jgi:hydrogenase expression/formation protein HypE